MEILETKAVYKAQAGGRTWLTMHERTYKFNGKDRKYFFASRSENPTPPDEKRPDAVIVVAKLRVPGQPVRLVMVDEFRVPIGRRELSFPAGLIDEKDWQTGRNAAGLDSHNEQVVAKCAAISAAVREMKEETGYDFTATEVSPTNIYSSAGLSDESVVIVLGEASGTPAPRLEASEDIRVVLPNRSDLLTMDADPELCVSKVAWPFIWAFRQLPTW